jgi:hypothetical protein
MEREKFALLPGTLWTAVLCALHAAAELVAVTVAVDPHPISSTWRKGRQAAARYFEGTVNRFIVVVSDGSLRGKDEECSEHSSIGAYWRIETLRS